MNRNEELQEIDIRLAQLEELFQKKPLVMSDETQRRFWADREEERRLALQRRHELQIN